MIHSGPEINYCQELEQRVRTKSSLSKQLYKYVLDLIITGTQIDPSFKIDDPLKTGLNEKQTAAGLDLALLASCNHTITSYGSYSFWASFLAGNG